MKVLTGKVLVLFVFTLLIGCNKPQTSKTSSNGFTVWDIIEKTEAIAPQGLKGEFVLSIKNSGKQSGRIYLNTQEDYRDRRNITVTLEPSFQQAFKAKHDIDIRSHFEGQKLLVRGEAKRMKVWFFSQGKRTEKYYFQTHIVVKKLDQISIL